MRRIHFLMALLLMSFVGYAQSVSLPIDFESTVTTSNFVDFDGGIGTVIPNPQSSGINTSATVGQIVRNGGEIWSGSKFIMTNNLDFSVNQVITLKVYTAVPVGTMMKIKLEGNGGFAERDAFTTISNGWETLRWDFTGVPANFNELVMMFDFGNVGDGSVISTFLIDDIEQSPTGTQLNLPIDFEAGVTASNFVDFDGGTASIIANPQSGGTNTSASVGQIVRNGGQIWGGSKILLQNDLDFTSNSQISMKVYTSAPAGTVVKMKLEAMAGLPPVELDVMTTTSNAWETLTWDFIGTPTEYNDLALMFDFGNVGDGSVNSTFLFDDIQKVGGPLGAQIDLPVTFEDTSVNYGMTDFGGNASMLIVDPTNSSNMVMQVTKTATAELWAGTTISTPAGLASNIPFSTSDTKMTVRVWSPDANIPVRLKVENANDNTQTCETEAMTTLAGGWENLEFDFANEVAGTAALSNGLNAGWTYSMASIFFNFGTTGQAAGAKTYYFDNVIFGVATSVSNNNVVEGLNIFPNPATAHWMISSENTDIISVEVFDLQGKQVLYMEPNSRNVTIDATTLASGVYISKVSTKLGTQSMKMIKE
jgi:hypothetical protein